MIVGETRCDCLGGFRVMAAMPDGREIVTDANGTTSTDLAAWAGQVRERSEHLDFQQRLLVRMSLVEARLVMRSCSDCGGEGWLFRLHRDGEELT